MAVAVDEASAAPIRVTQVAGQVQALVAPAFTPATRALPPLIGTMVADGRAMGLVFGAKEPEA